jgi:hypothetical protein
MGLLWRHRAREIAEWTAGLAAALVEGACLWAFDSLPAWAKWATLGGAVAMLGIAVLLMRRDRLVSRP